MKAILSTLAAAMLALTTSLAGGSPECLRNSLPFLTAAAVNEDVELRDSSIVHLRNLGPQGLNALLEASKETLAKGKGPAFHRITTAIDRVAAQRDAHLSGLYWHTDLDKAKAYAAVVNKPILSLRLLGELHNEYSCANSRFFRTTLYTHPEVSAFLRKNFVLHWKTVRPIPVITIDFGDGRKVERTITGNSAHYILDQNGRPVDGIPGLYGPAAFMRQLKAGHGMASAVTKDSDKRFAERVREFHSIQREYAINAWQKDLSKIRGNDVTDFERLIASSRSAEAQSKPVKRGAGEAGLAAVTKFLAEGPLLRSMALAAPSPETMKAGTTDKDWKAIAALHHEDARLADASIRLIREENPQAAIAGRIARGKMKVESPLVKMVASFQRSIAEDSVRNEYLLHSQIHQWFMEKPLQNAETLNKRVYAELFLTPDTDPWLGLVPENTYTGLENGGLVTAGSR